MPQQIRRFGIGQTAKVIGVLYGLIGVFLLPIFLVLSLFSPEQRYGSGFAIALPILYGGLGFLTTAIGCAIYNAVAGWVGGIEVELDGGASA